MLPVRGPSGSGGVATDTAPTFEAAGQAIGLRVPLPNCASLHACRPLAAEGFRPMPAGRVTRAVRIVEVSCPVALGSIGSLTSVVSPAGASTWLVPGSVASDGLKGIEPQSFGLVPGGSFASTKGEPLG